MEYLYFYDCPRTGGTSIKKWFRDNPCMKRLHYGTTEQWHHVPFQPIETLNKDFNRSKIKTLTFLRDPISQTVSLYAKIKNHRDHSFKDHFSKMTFSEWINGSFREDVISCPEPWGFSFVRFYAQDGMLDTAITNISTINFIGFTERLDKDMNLFLANIPAIYNGHRLNVSHKDFKISINDKKIIREVRASDYKLVNHFRKVRGLPLYE